jgi:ABC-type transporter Mla subunit MlaD
MANRRKVSIAGNPLLIGAVTTLLVVVAVYLSYNANNGLPFVPTYNLQARLPDADGLIKGNDVRMGGTRVGLVAKLVPYQEPGTGRSIAIAELKLNKNIEPLPADTDTSVLSRSSVGLKYLELIKGTSTQTLKSGSTLGLSHYREPVELDEFFDMFNKRTRQASQENLINGGNGFAERGPSLNETIHQLRPLTANLIPVMRNLAAPRTGFGEFWRALDRPAQQTAVVAKTNAAFFSDLDTFFHAWASVPRSIEKAIEGGPAALRQATYSLHYEQPFFKRSAQFMRLLRPSAAALVTAAKPLAGAVRAGTVNLRSAVALNTRLESFLGKLRTFSTDPVVNLAVEELSLTTKLGNTVVAAIAPEQATCNYITLALRNIASLLDEDVGPGTAARVGVVLPASGSNSEGGPASAPAQSESPEATSGPQYNANYLHANPYPNVAGPGQPDECEAGNEIYEPKTAVIGHATKLRGSTSESTKREDNIYGETYPATTLKALGITTTTTTTRARKK